MTSELLVILGLVPVVISLTFLLLELFHLMKHFIQHVSNILFNGRYSSLPPEIDVLFTNKNWRIFNTEYLIKCPNQLIVIYYILHIIIIVIFQSSRQVPVD